MERKLEFCAKTVWRKKKNLHVFPLRRAKENKENSVTKKKVRSKNQPKARFPEAQRIHTPSRPAKTGAGMTRERFWMTRPGFRTGGRLKAAFFCMQSKK